MQCTTLWKIVEELLVWQVELGFLSWPVCTLLAKMDRLYRIMQTQEV